MYHVDSWRPGKDGGVASDPPPGGAAEVSIDSSAGEADDGKIVTPGSKEKGKRFITRQLGPIKGTLTKCMTHGFVDLDPLTLAVMDTAPVQRLSGLLQLGCCRHVYKDATHTRFQHSVGVAYLARITCLSLRENQPLLGITDVDVACVALAGLVHDLGHGPFSHMYEGEVQKRARKKEGCGAPPFCHEEASLMMFDFLLKNLGLAENLEELDLPLKQVGDGIDADSFGVKTSNRPGSLTALHSRDIVFIKECILGGPLPGSNKFRGRGVDKEFLYDIVANRHSGLDVDKLDYYMRDTQHCIEDKADFSLLIKEIRVARARCPNPTKCHECRSSTDGPKEHLMAVWPRKLVVTTMNFFKKRLELHKNIYTHRKTKAVEFMIVDILEMAMPYFKPAKLKFHSVLGAASDPEAYINLKDDILTAILFKEMKELKPAQDLIERLNSRDLYKFVKSLPMRDDKPNLERYWNMDENEIVEGIVSAASVALERWDVIVEKLQIHHGKKDKNPVDYIRFLTKSQVVNLHDTPLSDLPVARKVNESEYESHIPRSFQERTLRIFCRRGERRRAVEKAFDVFIKGDIGGPIATLPSELEPSVLTQDDKFEMFMPINKEEGREHITHSDGPFPMTQESEDENSDSEDSDAMLLVASLSRVKEVQALFILMQSGRG
eukprot:CAMPEP_0194332306 /NCGR_PEP_ID=MMETSP0171-20130528/58703_1 /TAXON_ID=218684 /ORGANISM="Corethron pennatum, Strain L29A3" /LENGTH=663 /DNA_ID=CAMNT_0039094095 /DNA_START=210 /DNA_END=2202 /DNA_ORIENTATION=+